MEYPMRTGYLALESKRALRNPRFLFFTVAFPVAIFFIDAAVFGKQTMGGGVSYTSYLMCSLAAYGGFAAALATGARTSVERAAGWQRQLRLTPLSPRGYLATKGMIGMVVALPPIVVIAILGMAVEGVRLSAGGWAQVVLGVWIACVPFAVLGLLVGQVANAETMQVFSAGITMLCGFLGGIFIPVAVFPHWLSGVAKVLPSYWLAEVGHGALLGNADIGMAALVLAAWTVVLGFAVVRRYQRDSARS
jgi:ABC-2 type transport system permease protein